MPTTAKPKLYSPRHPERTLLYQIVAEHYETWLELASAGQLQQGQLDVSLNGKGQWQAQRTAKALADEAIDAIYTSDLSRARATAQAIADHSHAAVRPTVHLQTGLRGRGFGCFEGLTYAQIATDWPEDNRRWRQRDPSYAPEGGETLLQLRERVAETVHLLASQHAGE